MTKMLRKEPLENLENLAQREGYHLAKEFYGTAIDDLHVIWQKNIESITRYEKLLVSTAVIRARYLAWLESRLAKKFSGKQSHWEILVKVLRANGIDIISADSSRS
jgi:hypothetical protein